MSSSNVAQDKCPRCVGGKETFHYFRGDYVYDVDRARELVRDGREAVEVEEESVRESVDECDVDDFHLPHVDPTIPGIIAHIQYQMAPGELVKGHVLIDGHHRAARCLRDGVPFNAYLLDEEESQSILIREQGKRAMRETDDEKSEIAESITARYCEMFAGSEEISRRSKQVIAGATTHDRRGFGPFGIYVARGQGAWKWDVNDTPLLDYWMGHGALLMGHQYRPVVDAVQKQIELGTHFGACHELEVRWAELIRSIIPSAERVRFTSSGTEATALAARVARAYTNRQQILKFDGHFHGWHDEAMAHNYDSASSGFNRGALKNVLRVGQDKPEVVFDLIRKGDIAGVILEPGGGSAGGYPWDAGFLRDLREQTSNHGTLLIFDEVISGFRQSPGGVQAETGILPDLTTLAKIVSGGLPGGALVGQQRFMSVFGSGMPRGSRWVQVPHTGTFNANPLCAAAGIAMLENIRDGVPQTRAHAAARNLVDSINDLARLHDVDIFFYTNGTSIFHLLIGAYKKALPLGPSSAVSSLYGERPDLYALLRRALLLEGLDCHLIHGWVSALHDDAEVLRKTTHAYDRAFDRLKGIPGFRR